MNVNSNLITQPPFILNNDYCIVLVAGHKAWYYLKGALSGSVYHLE